MLGLSVVAGAVLHPYTILSSAKWAKKASLSFFYPTKTVIITFLQHNICTYGHGEKKRKQGNENGQMGTGSENESEKPGKQDRGEKNVSSIKGGSETRWKMMQMGRNTNTHTYTQQSDARRHTFNFAFYLTGNQRKGSLAAAS